MRRNQAGCQRFLPDREEPKKTGRSSCRKLLSSRSTFLLSSAFIRVHSRPFAVVNLRPSAIAV
jgi:hypothetical protein